MNTMTHKGYTARIEFDDRDNIFAGRILEIGRASCREKVCYPV